MSGTLADLQAQVAENTTVIASATVLIQGFAAKLAAAGTDPTALAALSADLAKSDAALAQAVAANTPAQAAPATTGTATTGTATTGTATTPAA